MSALGQPVEAGGAALDDEALEPRCGPLEATRASVAGARSWTGVASDLLALTKPRITSMVVTTTLGGMWLAGRRAARSEATAFWTTLGGTALVVAAANTLNMYLERDTDALMDRTRDRPLPAGRLPADVALVLGMALAAISLPWLTFGVNAATGALAAVALVSYVLLYTPLKGRTTASLLIGAVRGGIPPLLGWTDMTETTELGTVDWAHDDYFGESVAISADGNSVIVGAFYGGSIDQGAAYLFTKPGGGWAGVLAQPSKLTASDGAANDRFGNSVSISGDGVTIAIGAPWSDIGANADQGSAYVFVQPVDTTATITSDNPDPSVVGQSVVVSYTVTSTGGTPTDNVTVSDGVDSCTDTVAAGTCSITLTTAGARTLTATYAGNANFNGSSDTEPHQVNYGLSLPLILR